MDVLQAVSYTDMTNISPSSVPVDAKVLKTPSSIIVCGVKGGMRCKEGYDQLAFFAILPGGHCSSGIQVTNFHNPDINGLRFASIPSQLCGGINVHSF